MDILSILALGAAVLFLVAIYVIAEGAGALAREEQVDARKAWDNLLNQKTPSTSDPAGVLDQARKIVESRSHGEEAVGEAERILSSLWTK